MKVISAAVGAIAVGFAALLHAPDVSAQFSGAVAPPWRDHAANIPSSGNSAAGPAVSSVFPNEGWASLTAMPAARWAHAMASYTTGTYPDNAAFIYVISGSDASFANTSTLSRYDVAAASWSDLAPMSPSRTQISAARIGGKIYVPGGYGGSFNPTTALSIYDIANDQWSAGAPLPQATGDYAIGAYADHYVYVIGGYSGSADLNNVQVYDTTLDSWQNATAKPGNAVAGLRGGIVGNRIVVSGGYGQLLGAELADTYVGTIDPTNPFVISWAAVDPYPSGPVGRAGAGVPVSAGPAQGAAGLNFVVFTGGDPNGQGTSVKADTWIYDLNDAVWKSAPDKPTGVSNICNIAGVSSGGKLQMVTTGGYNGTVITTVNEWLSFGYETPPDLALEVTASSDVFDANSTLVYTLDYSVGTPGSAESVTISDIVPADSMFDADDSSPGWVCIPDNNAGSVCSIALGTLSAGASDSVLFAIDTPVAPADSDQIENDASISTVAVYGPEQNLANNAASVSTPFSTRIFADGFGTP